MSIRGRFGFSGKKRFKLEWNPGLYINGMNKKGRLNIWVWAATIAVFAISVIFTYRLFFKKAVFTGKNKTVAVLPFVNLGADTSEEYLSDGMTEEIINQLSKFNGLRVTGRSSVMKYKGHEKNVLEIADTLHVASVLTGGVRKSGNKLIIQASLIDVGSGKSIWSESFDRDINDIFSIQTEVAQLIADKLNTEISKDEINNIHRRSTQNLEAYDKYLEGLYFWNKGSNPDLRKAISFFNQAIQLDSGYAKAYSGLADCYSALGYASYDKPADAFLKAELAANKALQLDSTLAEPHTSLGYIKFYYYWDWPNAQKEFLTAMRLNPNYIMAYDSYCYYLTAMERFTEAREVIEKAVQLDPLSARMNTDLGFNLYYLHHYDEAIRTLKTSLTLNPKYGLAHIWLARTYLDKKMYKEALEENNRVLKSNTTWPVALAAIGYIYGITGQRQDAVIILDSLIRLSSSKYVTPYGVALVYAALNDKENAFKCLDQAYADRANWLVWLKLDPRWRPLYDDKRYAALVEKVGLPKITGKFSKQ
jgi:TolB-like protein/Flp pilus assembly protein TadD